MRMIRKDRYKLIYYPVGNRFQLFDLISDPNEMIDLSEDPSYNEIKCEAIKLLVNNMYGADKEWIVGDNLVGQKDKVFKSTANRGLSAQRGWR